jgi:hypothetical protein
MLFSLSFDEVFCLPFRRGKQSVSLNALYEDPMRA